MNQETKIETRPVKSCPNCNGTGHVQLFMGGIIKLVKCKCVKPRKVIQGTNK